MRVISSYANEGIRDFIIRALDSCKNGRDASLQIWCTGIVIDVYKDSCIDDLIDKFDMQRRINQLESQYRR